MTVLVMTDFAGNKIREPFSWSFSRLRNFETCPRRYNEVDILKKFKDEDSDERGEGFRVHRALAKRISQGATLPDDLKHYEKWIDYVSKGIGVPLAERKLAVTRDFRPCDFFDKVKPVWLRTVADVLRIDGAHAHVVDWKTGKVKRDADQLMLIATCAMVHYPQVFDVTAELIWLGNDTKTTLECTVEDIVGFWEYMHPKVDKLQLAHEKNDFPPTPSGLCRRHCPVTSCKHCGQ